MKNKSILVSLVLLASTLALNACSQGNKSAGVSDEAAEKQWGANKRSAVEMGRVKLTDEGGKAIDDKILQKPFGTPIKVSLDGTALNGDSQLLHQSALCKGIAAKISNKLDGAFLNLPWSKTTALVGGFSTIAVPNKDNVVFICGGDESPNRIRFAADHTWLADLSAGKASPGPELKSPRKNCTLTVLKDGKILISGGRGGTARGGGPDSEAGQVPLTELLEIFDPATNEISDGGNMNVLRDETSTVVLGNGQVLIAGGDPPGKGDSSVDANTKRLTAEVYDPATKKCKMLGPLKSLSAIRWGAPVGDNKALLLGTTWGVQFGGDQLGQPAAELVEINEK